MTDAIRNWWSGLSLRERVLVGIAGGLSALLIGWFLIFTPMTRALAEQRLAHAAALDRNGAVAWRVAEIRRLQSQPRTTPAAQAASGATVALALTQAAAEGGFTLARNDAEGNDAATIAIANAKAPTVIVWLDGLAAQGLAPADITLRPNADGTVALTARIRRAQ
jgi:general secretion pathway protein M